MVSSPCVGRCRIDETSDLCSGCARSRAEVAAWRDAAPEFRERVWAALPERRIRLGLKLHRLNWDLEALRTFLIWSFHAGGTWTTGAPGAVAEFRLGDGEPCQVESNPVSVRAFSTRGAIAIGLGDFVRPFALTSDSGNESIVLAIPRGRALPFPDAGLVRVGPDRESVHERDRDEILYDFGLNRVGAGFGVRTSRSELIARLDGAAGLDWRQFLPSIGEDLCDISPTRVVRNSIGRIEVFSAIPPPDGASPEGPHTHLWPRFLAEQREMPAGLDLADAYVACAVYYPPKPGPLTRFRR